MEEEKILRRGRCGKEKGETLMGVGDVFIERIIKKKKSQSFHNDFNCITKKMLIFSLFCNFVKCSFEIVIILNLLRCPNT